MTGASALRIAALVPAAALAGCSPASDSRTNHPDAAQVSSRTVDHKDPVASAMAAAPASIAQDATIVTMDAAGKMTTLRAGTNGFTCMPDNPATPGRDPMCMDRNAMEWTAAWVGRKTPPAEQPGVMYMLAPSGDHFTSHGCRQMCRTGPPSSGTARMGFVALTGVITYASRRSGDMVQTFSIGVDMTFVRFEPSAFIVNT